MNSATRPNHVHQGLASLRFALTIEVPTPSQDIAWLNDLQRAEALGLDPFLLVTGDKVRHPPADRPVRYLDSLNALVAPRQRSREFLLAAAISPFKYREEKLVNQHLKAAKKLRGRRRFPDDTDRLGPEKIRGSALVPRWARVPRPPDGRIAAPHASASAGSASQG